VLTALNTKPENVLTTLNTKPENVLIALTPEINKLCYSREVKDNKGNKNSPENPS